MQYDESYIRSLIARVNWTLANSHLNIPREYIIRGQCGLTDEEFEYFICAIMEFGSLEMILKANRPHLYIDGYKYWTMVPNIKKSIIIDRQKVFSEFDSIDVVKQLHPDETYDKIAQFFNMPFNGRYINEFGCGAGATYEHFHIEPTHYRGCDPSKKAIEQFKQSHPEISHRLFCYSFEESIDFWGKPSTVLLATFGAASYFMRQYLEILANKGQDYFLMFYKEDYCPEQFKGMHHFNYTDNDLQSMFPNIYIIRHEDYRIVTSLAVTG